jgi:hypothetical protein
VYSGCEAIATLHAVKHSLGALLASRSADRKFQSSTSISRGPRFGAINEAPHAENSRSARVTNRDRPSDSHPGSNEAAKHRIAALEYRSDDGKVEGNYEPSHHYGAQQQVEFWSEKLVNRVTSNAVIGAATRWMRRAFSR